MSPVVPGRTTGAHRSRRRSGRPTATPDKPALYSAGTSRPPDGAVPALPPCEGARDGRPWNRRRHLHSEPPVPATTNRDNPPEELAMPLRSDSENFALIRVIGVGGGGSNAVNRMIRAEMMGVELIAGNTDAHALLQSTAPHKIRIGDKTAQGPGTR